MIDWRFYLSLIIAKLTALVLKIFHKGATAAPGLYAQKIDKNILKKLARQLKFSILVSGTNGKTTTTRILSSILKQANIKYLHNRSGSNLERGIISQLIKHHQLKNYLGLWEVDEAALPSVSEKIQPKIIILLNLFRDQLDRYGEIDTLAKKWLSALKKLPKETTIILNADDPTIAWLGKQVDYKVIYFGIRDELLGGEALTHASDATFCPICLLPLKYRTCFISHLGIYECLKCGSIQPKPDLKAEKVSFTQQNTTLLKLDDNPETNQLIINFIGTYNVYNSLAAFAGAQLLNINIDNIKEGIRLFKPAFGRLETINFKDKQLKILLVKNPTGFNEAIKTVLQSVNKNSFSCLLILNDLIADGRDVSWIWDVDLETLVNNPSLKKIIVSGIRAEDMALRIKYSNIKMERYKDRKIEKKLEKAINNLLVSQTKDLFILPTYTAMLEVRKILNKKGLVHSTWKD